MAAILSCLNVLNHIRIYHFPDYFAMLRDLLFIN